MWLKLKEIVFRIIALPAILKGLSIDRSSWIAPGYDWLTCSWRDVVIGRGVRIGRRAWIQTVKGSTGSVKIGDRCAIGRDVVISSSLGIRIGYDCLISYRVSILDHDHNFDNYDVGTLSEVGKSREIEIGNRVFIGANAMILKGSVVEDDSIIGGNSLVSGYFPKGSVIAGNPARVIRMRSE